jgi:hypothetical protein
MPSKKSVRLGQQGKAAGFPILSGGFAVSGQLVAISVAIRAQAVGLGRCQVDQGGSLLNDLL